MSYMHCLYCDVYKNSSLLIPKRSDAYLEELNVQEVFSLPNAFETIIVHVSEITPVSEIMHEISDFKAMSILHSPLQECVSKRKENKLFTYLHN